ncbi:MAG: hypothetical protein ABR866_17785 [Candidatus Korobacteraceae bacterium]|jgi:hypothetical protein
MAIYYSDKQKDEIREWLLELQAIIPDRFIAKRDRARELVALLDENPTHPACLISYEYQRLRKIWRRLETQAESQP